MRYEVYITLNQRVLELIKGANGKSVGRRYLVFAIFGVTADNLANSTYDRAIRRAIAELQSEYPIISSSSDGGGYRWPKDAEEAEAYARELRSRAQKMTKKARDVERAVKVHFYQPDLPT